MYFSQKKEKLVNIIGGKHNISAMLWAVSLVRKKKSKHAFLIIEGYDEKKNDRFILRSDLFVDLDKKYATSYFSGKESIYKGKALIKMKEINYQELKNLASISVYQCWSISKKNAIKLFDIMEKDVELSSEDKQDYNVFGDGKSYSSFFSNKSYHNCLSWCKKVLKKVNLKIDDNWYDFICVSPKKTSGISTTHSQNKDKNKDKNKKSKELKVSEDNRVIIRIWPPIIGKKTTKSKYVVKDMFKNPNKQVTRNVGHVSLEIPGKNIYASWWPHPDEPITSMFKVTKALNNNLKNDKISESGDPRTIASLFSLNTKAIITAFKMIKDSKKYGYVLTGDTSFARSSNDKKGQSCCSMIDELLKIGGIERIDFGTRSMSQSIITPDNFEKFIKKVKDNEVKLAPKTANYSKIDNNEYVPEIKNKNKLIV